MGKYNEVNGVAEERNFFYENFKTFLNSFI
jgi:hypothetical protein